MAAPAAMLIDDFLPDYHEVERHRLVIAAPPDVVYAALSTADLGSHPLIRGLLATRMLPTYLKRPGTGLRRLGTLRRSGGLTLAALCGQGFSLLAEEPGREVLLGVVGKFWRLSEPCRNPRDFRRRARPSASEESRNGPTVSSSVPYNYRDLCKRGLRRRREVRSGAARAALTGGRPLP